MSESDQVIIQPVIRFPRVEGDPTSISPWKNNTALRRDLLRLADFIPVMLMIEKAMGDHDCGVQFSAAWWGTYIQLTAADEADARKIVGYLIRAFKCKQTTKKVGDDQLEAEWIIDGVTVTVKGYKPSTCRYEEIEVKVPAQRKRIEKKVIPASKARIEKRRVLVCDDVKIEEQRVEEVAAASEVPF